MTDRLPTAREGIRPDARPAESDRPGAAEVAPLLVRETIERDVIVNERALWRGRREHISYTACNEDSACELQALAPGPGQRIFCVTAGGGRVLDLVASGPEEVWAVDLNPTQNHLLELKVAGTQALTFDEQLAFLGVRPSRQRLATYARVRPRLTPAAQGFFDRHPRLLRAGVIYQGDLERFLARVIVPVLRLLRPVWVRRLMAARTVAEQERLFRERGTRIWRALVANLARRRFLDWFSRESRFWCYLPPEIPLHTRVVSKVFGYLESHVARDSHFANLLFCGRYVNEASLPRHLQPQGFAELKAALGRTRLHLLTGTVGDGLHQAPEHFFDAFALSDIGSYLDDVSFASLFEQVVRTGRSGARICSRGILYHRELPADVARHVHRLPELERAFARDDASMVHEFLIGELQ